MYSYLSLSFDSSPCIFICDLDLYRGNYMWEFNKLVRGEADIDTYIFSGDFFRPKVMLIRKRAQAILKKHIDIAPSREIDLINLSVDLLELFGNR